MPPGGRRDGARHSGQHHPPGRSSGGSAASGKALQPRAPHSLADRSPAAARCLPRRPTPKRVRRPLQKSPLPLRSRLAGRRLPRAKLQPSRRPEQEARSGGLRGSFPSRPAAALLLLWRAPSPGKRRRRAQLELQQPASLTLSRRLGSALARLPEVAASSCCRGARAPFTAPSPTCFLCYYRHPTPSGRACVLEAACTPTLLHEWGAFDFLPLAATESGRDGSIA